MTVAVFYHLTRSGQDETIGMILTRALGQGWRVMLRGPDPVALATLDERLWLGPEDGFLPHGLQGGPQDADQPILLGTGAIGNAAQGLVLLDGADLSLDEIAGLERVWLLFDGSDAAAVERARAQWRRLTEAGISAQYWSDQEGRWQMKAEKASGAG